LTKLKLFQKPLDILSSGILLTTDCRFMSCWRNDGPTRRSSLALDAGEDLRSY
jgi:hypothetical protein